MITKQGKHYLEPQALKGARVIRFLDRGESRYPQLMRLCLDFGFQVLQLQPEVFSHISRKWVPGQSEFLVAFKEENQTLPLQITSAFSSLQLLNDHVKRNEVDILHHHLFGDDAEALAQLLNPDGARRY